MRPGSELHAGPGRRLGQPGSMRAGACRTVGGKVDDRGLDVYACAGGDACVDLSWTSTSLLHAQNPATGRQVCSIRTEPASCTQGTFAWAAFAPCGKMPILRVMAGNTLSTCIQDERDPPAQSKPAERGFSPCRSNVNELGDEVDGCRCDGYPSIGCADEACCIVDEVGPRDTGNRVATLSQGSRGPLQG